MGSGILQKCFHILAYGVQLQCLNAGALGWNSKAIPIMTKAFAPASTMLLICHTGSTSTMNSGFVGAEYENLLHLESFQV